MVMVICLEQGADLHMAQLMPVLLTVSCFSKIQIGFTFLVLANPGSPGKRAVKRVCVCVCVPQVTYSVDSILLAQLAVASFLQCSIFSVSLLVDEFVLYLSLNPKNPEVSKFSLQLFMSLRIPDVVCGSEKFMKNIPKSEFYRLETTGLCVCDC